MLTAVREGEQVDAPSWGGDPFIFGRGGEEVEHLRAQGVQVRVINGITAGLAGMTALGVPLTHRAHAHGVVFVTGHAKPGAAGTDWRQLAATARDARLTLVIYIGRQRRRAHPAGIALGSGRQRARGHHPERQPAHAAPCRHYAGRAAHHHRA